MSSHPLIGLVVVGGGPGGLAPLFAAASHQRLTRLLQSGVIVLEKSAHLGSGELSEQTIRSDSAAEAFLEIVVRTDHPQLTSLRDHPSFAAVEAHVRDAVPLPLVAEFLRCAAKAMEEIINTSPRGRVYRQATALSTQQISTSEWRTIFLNHMTGRIQEIRSTSVILATGAHQPEQRLYNENVAGEPLMPRYRMKVLSSGHVLRSSGLVDVSKRLRNFVDPKVVIVGGSASAGSVAQVLLNRPSTGTLFGTAGVTLLHRSQLRLFYGSAAKARADDYTDWDQKDVCHLTGRVHRLGGLRFDSREVIMRARSIGGRLHDPRVRLLTFSNTNLPEARKVLEEADLIVAAIGYVPRALPVFNAQNRRVSLMIDDGAASRAMVDIHSRVLDAAGRVLEGLYSIGLATGRPSTPDIGGELGFKGQVNSIWLWQHIIGIEIVNQVLSRSTNNQVSYECVSQSHVFPPQFPSNQHYQLSPPSDLEPL